MDILNTQILYIITKLRTNEHVKAHEDLFGIIEPDTVNIPEVQEPLAAYGAGIERLKLIFRHSPESPETKNISGFDGRRDELWVGGKRIVKLYQNSSDPLVRAAAEEVRILMNAYGNVPRFSLYGETGSLRHAIDNFKKPEFQPKVALIPGLAALIDELEIVNNGLDTLYRQRLQEAETLKQLGKLTDCLPLVDKLLIALFSALNTVYNYNEMTNKLPALKATIERIALNTTALFDQLKKVIDRRKKKTGSGKQKPDITNPEIPEPGDGNDGGDTDDGNDGEDGNDGDGNDGGDNGGGDNGDGGPHNPDTTNPPIPPFIPDFE